MAMPGTYARRTLLPLVLATSLAGCATPSPPLVRPPAIPQPPAELMLPDDSQRWLPSVEQLFRRWLLMLRTAEPA